MIYFDHAATSKPLDSALKSAERYLTECFYNPSARYAGARDVSVALEGARDTVLKSITDGMRYSLVFTSGGTEADNTAIFSAAKRGNIVTDEGEHAAVYESFKAFQAAGGEARFAPLNRDGSVNAERLLSLVDEKTTLVSVLHVNNETGAINDINALAKRVKEKSPRCLFMSDGVQSYGKIPVYLNGTIDFYTASAHKIGGVKGTGALFVKKGIALTPRLFGGGQEGGLRSGTENVYGAVCFAAAARERFSALEENAARLTALRELLWEKLDHNVFVRISPENGSPYILTVAAKGRRGEVLQRILWEKGIAVGTGSACNSKKPFSRVIAACGYQNDVLGGVLRASFSPATTEEEIGACAQAMNECAAAWKA